MNILVTGASGNIGIPLVKELSGKEKGHRIFVGVRNVDKAQGLFAGQASLGYREFDFEAPASFAGALKGIDLVFLLRPPHISDIEGVFRPLLDAMRAAGIGKAVLLSVQGAETSDIIPHRKIEKLIIEYKMDYIFVRPSYFMQNLTTTLGDDIRKRRSIALPAKDAKFNWVDIGDIAELCARFLTDFDEHRNRAYVVSGAENLSFPAVVERINLISGAGLSYKAVSPPRFILLKLGQGLPLGMVLVMVMLHFLPRFQAEPEIADTYRGLTGKAPTGLDDFIRANQAFFAGRG